MYRPDIPGSHEILFFAASDFIFIPWHIYNWVSLPLWPRCFILSGAISSSPLFPWSISDTFQPGGLIFHCHTFLSFNTVHEVLMASILGSFAIPSSSGSHFVITLNSDASVLGGPTQHGSELHFKLLTTTTATAHIKWSTDAWNTMAIVQKVMKKFR